MSYQLLIDDADAGDVASNQGWRDFTEWVTLLDDVDELRQLTEYGIADDVSALIKDLESAIKNGEPEETVKETGDGLLKKLRDKKEAAHIVVTSGDENADGDA